MISPPGRLTLLEVRDPNSRNNSRTQRNNEEKKATLFLREPTFAMALGAAEEGPDDLEEAVGKGL